MLNIRLRKGCPHKCVGRKGQESFLWRWPASDSAFRSEVNSIVKDPGLGLRPEAAQEA